MQNIINLSSVIDEKYIYTIIIIVFFLLVRWIIHKFIKNKISQIAKRYRYYKITTYTIFFLLLIIILPMWIDDFQSLSTFLGLFSAGLAISLRDVIINFFGWIYILSRRPFTTGDRIEINDIKGDVIDIKLMEFTLMEVGQWVEAEQSTGRIIYVPNGKILNSNIANFTKGFELIWNELTVLITFESDWKKAKSILTDIAEINSLELNKNLKESIIHSARKNYQKLTPIVYTSIKESGIQLTIRYLCEPRKRRTSSEIFWEDILEKFKNENDIEFAYKTYRQYNPELKDYIESREREGEKQ